MAQFSHRAARYALVYYGAFIIEAFGVVAFLRVDVATGALAVRALDPYWLLVLWAMLRALQGFAAYVWARNTNV